MHQHSKEAAEATFARFASKFKQVIYLEGCIDNTTEQDEWIDGEVSSWLKTIIELSSIATMYPQFACTALQKLLQHEWQFLQQVVEGIPDRFSPIEDAITDAFLPALFGTDVPTTTQDIIALPVKLAGLALPNPIATYNTNCISSELITSHIVAALRECEDFSFHAHKLTIKVAKSELRKQKLNKHER